jgi:predicted TIM-barrel fold metal-dependent hydrolase
MVYNEQRGWQLDTGLGRNINVGVFATAGMVPQTEEHDATERKGYAARASLTDIKARLKDMDSDGVAAEVLYPSAMGGFYAHEDEEIGKAALASYNDWLAEYVKDSEGRMFGLACVQVRDIDAAVAETERARRLGHAGIVIPSGSPDDRPYTDPAYDALWAKAQDLELPVAFHSGVGGSRAGVAPAFARHGLGYTMLHVGVSVTISDLIMSGVCDRFPDLHFVPAEFETGWIGHFLQRMDWRQFRREDRTKIKLQFSDYWHRNFHATFEDDEIGIRTRDIIGVGSLMWASDYPHGDSVWPKSRETIDRIMAGCAPSEKLAMTAKNVVELYKLPFEV